MKELLRRRHANKGNQVHACGIGSIQFTNLDYGNYMDLAEMPQIMIPSYDIMDPEERKFGLEIS